MANLQESPAAPSMLARALMLGLIVWVLMLVAGPITGPQAIFGALAHRGVFRDVCTNATEVALDPHHTCRQQEQKIEAAADLVLSICNFVCVLWGFARDTLGSHRVALFAMVLWTVSKACAGFYPDSGFMWTACESIAASASLGAYTCLGLDHLKDACAGSKRVYNVLGFVTSAAWDVAVLLNVPLALWLEYRGVTLWEAYMTYGLVAGLPVLLGLLMWPVKHDTRNSEPGKNSRAAAVSSDTAYAQSPTIKTGDKSLGTIQDGDGDSVPSFERSNAAASSSPKAQHSPAAQESEDARALVTTTAAEEEEAPKSLKELLQRSMSDIRAILTTLSFWLFTAHCSVVVVLGYFMITHVGTLGEAHGLETSADRADARRITTYMMAAMGLTTVVPGKILFRLGTRRGLIVLMALECLLIVGTSVCISFGNVATFYAAYGLALAWRVWGFGLSFPYISWRFAAYSRGSGVCYGGVFAVGGAISAGVGALAGSLLHSDPQKHALPVMLTLCGVSFAAEAVFAWDVWRTDLPDQHDGAEAPQDVLDEGLLNGDRVDQSVPSGPIAAANDDGSESDSSANAAARA